MPYIVHLSSLSFLLLSKQTRFYTVNDLVLANIQSYEIKMAADTEGKCTHVLSVCVKYFLLSTLKHFVFQWPKCCVFFLFLGCAALCKLSWGNSKQGHSQLQVCLGLF